MQAFRREVILTYVAVQLHRPSNSKAERNTFTWTVIPVYSCVMQVSYAEPNLQSRLCTIHVCIYIMSFVSHDTQPALSRIHGCGALAKQFEVENHQSCFPLWRAHANGRVRLPKKCN